MLLTTGGGGVARACLCKCKVRSLYKMCTIVKQLLGHGIDFVCTGASRTIADSWLIHVSGAAGKPLGPQQIHIHSIVPNH